MPKNIDIDFRNFDWAWSDRESRCIEYPPELCATGAGWAMATGRMGSFLGPLGAGFLLAAGLSVGQLFWIAAVPAVIAACSVLGVGIARERVNRT